jgi:hypothetical protein
MTRERQEDERRFYGDKAIRPFDNDKAILRRHSHSKTTWPFYGAIDMAILQRHGHSFYGDMDSSNLNSSSIPNLLSTVNLCQRKTRGTEVQDDDNVRDRWEEQVDEKNLGP